MIKNLKNTQKASNGITLIALVITIIVLLILAGISISMLSGDNGILQKATTAKENTDSSQIQERINLAYHSSLVEGQGKVTEPSLESELKKEFNKDTLDEDWLDKTSVVGKWKITIDGVSLEVPAGEKVDDKTTIKVGTTNLKEVSDLSTLYGETTDYTSVEGVEWQLFYDDNINIYLIASDYVPGDKLPSELLTEGQYTTYCRYFANWSDSTYTYTGTIIDNIPWSNGIESSTIAENEQTNIYLKWVNSSVVSTKNNPNMKAVAYMMDTSKWSTFAGSATGAIAIGGPTLEMFALSYNAKHDTKLGTYGNSKNDITSENANLYGYKVKMNTGSWSDSASGLDTTATDSDGNMWVRTSGTKAYGMWLASPSSDGEQSASTMQCGGILNNDPVSNTERGFRPLVSIPKSSLK